MLVKADGIEQSYKCECHSVNAVRGIIGTVLLMYERRNNPHFLKGDWRNVPLTKIKTLPK